MSQSDLIPSEIIEKRIYLWRGQKVLLDFHLAELYDIETKTHKRAVRRNIERFPNAFCFQLTKSELNVLRYHLGTSSWGGIRYLPFAFTEQGVAMLSSVLRSKKAIEVNISIMRIFVRLRHLLADHQASRKSLKNLNENMTVNSKSFLMQYVSLWLHHLQLKKKWVLQLKRDQVNTELKKIIEQARFKIINH